MPSSHPISRVLHPVRSANFYPGQSSDIDCSDSSRTELSGLGKSSRLDPTESIEAHL